MIPLGNWQDRIDELESENYDLSEANTRLDDEVSELLFEVDRLKDEIAVLEGQNQDWEGIAECARERAEKADNRIDQLKGQLHSAEIRAENAEDEIVRRDDHWTSECMKLEERAEKAEEEARHTAITALTIDNQSLDNYERAEKAEREFARLKLQFESAIRERDNETARAEWAEWGNREYSRVGLAILMEKSGIEGDRDGWRERAEKAEALLSRIRVVGDIPHGTSDENTVKHVRDLRDAERRADAFDELANQLRNRAEKAEARAASWFEVAKTMVRARDFWVEIAGKELERADDAEEVLNEFKAALRVLGGGR